MKQYHAQLQENKKETNSDAAIMEKSDKLTTDVSVLANDEDEIYPIESLDAG